ncbi:MAG: peptide chain release factor N(5)-glutamine methyltransferase [Ferruginibacter sp.]
MTLRDFYKYFIEKLSVEYDASEATAICSIVFEKIAAVTKKELITNQEMHLDVDKAIQISHALQELLTHRPVQYVIGEAWFYVLPFLVNEHVLIPRPETEELVRYVLVYLENRPPRKILDIGSGSGCIPVVIKKFAPENTIESIDISEEALQVAKKNAGDHSTEIKWQCLDFLDEENWSQLGHFDIIISNPPYIPESEKKAMDKNVAAYEPSLALFVTNERPLIFYEKILSFAEVHLNMGGKIFLETHKDLSGQVATLYANKNYKVEIKKDISGNDRMVIATRFR